jgi:hypothetical protein
LVRVPQMSLVGCSAEVRPNMGPDDDLQDVRPVFVDPHTLAIPTSDGSMLVCAVPSLATVWKGRAQLATARDGTSYLVDTDGHELLSINASGVAHVRALTEDESFDRLRETHPGEADDTAAIVRVSNASCHVGVWLFPAAACAQAR